MKYLMPFFLGIILSLPVLAATEAMPSMPKIEPKRTYTVKSAEEGENLQDARGYGDKESEIGMMNKMMVEGSGFEGMDMAAMAKMGGKANKMADNGSMNEMPGHSMKNMPEGKMDHSEMQMPMNQNKEPAGKPQASKQFSLTPMDGSKTFTVGPNQVVFKVTQGEKAAAKLKLKAKVMMTSMDMGTEEPRVRETKPGIYEVKAVFAMQGPWAVKIALPGGQEETLNFNVEKK